MLDWTVRYWEQATRAGLPVDADFGAFYRDFEWMGLQRHLKVLGIFARLYYRDGKTRLPRGHAALRRATCARSRARYAALDPLLRLLDELEGAAAQQRLHVLIGRHESHDPRGRPRRTHAPADRHDAQAAARGRRQAADRLASSRGWRAPASRDLVINHAHLGAQIEAALGDGAAFGRAHRLFARRRGAGDRRRHRQRAAAARATSPSPWSTATSTATIDFARLRSRALRRTAPTGASGAGRQSAAASATATSRSTARRAGNAAAPRLTFSGIGVYQPRAVRRHRAGRTGAARAAAARRRSTAAR